MPLFRQCGGVLGRGFSGPAAVTCSHLCQSLGPRRCYSHWPGCGHVTSAVASLEPHVLGVENGASWARRSWCWQMSTIGKAHIGGDTWLTLGGTSSPLPGKSFAHQGNDVGGWIGWCEREGSWGEARNRGDVSPDCERPFRLHHKICTYPSRLILLG